MKVFALGDIEIKYKVFGESGPVLMLLHGFGGGVNDWSTLAPLLANTYRVVVPNLKVFFSHHEPLMFSQQVRLLKLFVEYVLKQKQVSSISLCGQSYGATLSLGLKLSNAVKTDHQILINPMPFRPFDHVKDSHIQLLLNLGHLPGGVNLYLRTSGGRESLAALAQVFRIGVLGQHEVQHFNDRKLLLVEKAFERFRWIIKNESWSDWEERIHQSSVPLADGIICSSEDSLFSRADYQNVAQLLKIQKLKEVPHKGHLLVQDRGVEIFKEMSALFQRTLG